MVGCPAARRRDPGLTPMMVPCITTGAIFTASGMFRLPGNCTSTGRATIAFTTDGIHGIITLNATCVYDDSVSGFNVRFQGFAVCLTHYRF